MKMKTDEQEDLEFRIEEYNQFYRIGQPRISDEAYDKLLEELREKFPDSTLLKKSVIEQPKQSRKEKLPIPMYSLDKCKSLGDIKKWLKSKNVSKDELLVITPKYDGISLVVQELTGDCWTRGDGEVGQKSNKHFASMPKVGYSFMITTFGEAIMSKKNFQKYKSRYANPRNMVAGLFNRDEAVEELRDVDYIRYGSDREDLEKLRQIGLLYELNAKELSFYSCDLSTLTVELLDDLYREWSEDYQIDGLVIDINDADLRKQLGREENMNPAYARAYKNPEWSSSVIVKVTGVTWQVSKQGKLKPVIQIEPTEVAGVTIENVTGYNAAYIIDNVISKNALIKIIRSGDVIPKHIFTVSSDENEFEDMMDKITGCPRCGEQTCWDDTMTEIICTNPECKDKKIAKLVHFFKTIEIEDFGEPSIRKLYDAGFDTLEKILCETNYTNICAIEGFGEKSAKVLVDKLENINAPLAKIIHALDLTEGKIGEKTIQMIFDKLSDISDFKSSVYNIERLLQIDGVAEITAKIFMKAVDEYYSFYHGQNVALWNITYIITPKQEVVGDKFKDQKLCFTGCRPSKEMEQEIQSQGGEVVSGVSSKTTMLVVKDMSEKTLSSSKAQKAKELNIHIVEISKL